MIVLAVLGMVVITATNVALLAALILQGRDARTDRRALLDVLVSRHAGDLRLLRRAEQEVAASPEVKDFQRQQDQMFKDMGYDPESVPKVMHGLDGGR